MFGNVFEDMRDGILIELKRQGAAPDAIHHIGRMINYNVPHGKCVRGMLVVQALGATGSAAIFRQKSTGHVETNILTIRAIRTKDTAYGASGTRSDQNDSQGRLKKPLWAGQRLHSPRRS